ncbi:MAG: imidazolonepropionase [Gammaproteobacteria bacterium]|nr:imidazolonepropionase [Gammaproteobacteria bacterium]
MNRWTHIWTNVHLATMADQSPLPYGAIENAAIAVEGDRIAWLGAAADLPADHQATIHDGEGSWITPGLIDCHTHLVYGGSRSQEFELRLTGVSYDEIARRGGGIVSTVDATRKASVESLYQSAARRLSSFLNEGVTGIEIKSGYGLDRDTELKMLKVARRLGDDWPVDVATSFLGAHALPPEYSEKDAYIDWVANTMIPEVAQTGHADAVDVFCEGIAFDNNQCERIFKAAAANGLPIKAHVEQLSNSGGAALAASYGALSVDHLEYLDAAGVEAIKKTDTVAVLLPGAFYFLRETQLPPVERLRNAQVPIAIASDANPGSSPTCSLLLMLNMACTLFRLTPEESLRGVTRHAARALGWQKRLGTLEVGKQADFVLWEISSPGELSYSIGGNPCVSVIKNGCELSR